MKTKLFNKKGKENPAKFLGYIKLTDAFKKEGCAICRRIGEATFNYVDSLLYENVNDHATREKLKASFGFCVKHSELLFKIGDALGTAIIYKDILNVFLNDLTNKPFNGFIKKDSCPVCIKEFEQTDSDIKIFIDFQKDDEFINGFNSSDGLCAVHLQKIIERVDSSEYKKYLINFHVKKLDALIKDLNELIRKFDYRFSDEEIITNESSSWKRAVKFISGKKRD